MLKVESIQKISDLGLFISGEPFYPKNHAAWPQGYNVFKPSNVDGNDHEVYECWFEGEDGNDIKSCSPSVRMWNSNGQTCVEVSGYALGPGPGEFKVCFGNEDEAIDRIRNFFSIQMIRGFVNGTKKRKN